MASLQPLHLNSLEPDYCCACTVIVETLSSLLRCAARRSGLALPSACDVDVPPDSCTLQGSAVSFTGQLSNSAIDSTSVSGAASFRPGGENLAGLAHFFLLYRSSAITSARACLGDGPLPLDFRGIAACIADTLNTSTRRPPRAVLVFPQPADATWMAGVASPQGGLLVIFGWQTHEIVNVADGAGGTYSLKLVLLLLPPAKP